MDDLFDVARRNEAIVAEKLFDDVLAFLRQVLKDFISSVSASLFSRKMIFSAKTFSNLRPHKQN
jgi:hypothetical protein